jgi:hypothetical protein
MAAESRLGNRKYHPLAAIFRSRGNISSIMPGNAASIMPRKARRGTNS